MKKIYKIIITCLLMLCTFWMVCCSNDDEETEEIVLEPTLAKADVAVEVFEQFQLIVNDYDGTVVWSSKDETIATVSDTGLLQGASEGFTEVYAECDDVTLTCKVTVLSSENVPILSLGFLEQLELLPDDDYKIEPYVLYDGEKYYNGTYSFKISDETIASVSADGTVKGLKIGETELEISVDWETYKNDLRLKKVIPVNVKENANVRILDGESLDLYTYALTAYGKTYATSKTLRAVVEINCETADAQHVVWESSDENVATVDGAGNVTAVACGKAQITVSYQNGETVYSSQPLTVTVAKPLVDGTRKMPVLLDLYGADVDTGLAYDFSSIFLEDEVDVVSVTDESGNAVGYENGKFAVSNLAVGEYVWIVDNGNYSVKTKAIVATKVIRTADDLARMQEYGNLSEWTETHTTTKTTTNKETGEEETVEVATEYTLNSYAGYFVLGDDIDFSDYTYGEDGYLSRVSMNMSSWQLTTVGFSGVFEGLGYTISNVNLGFGGLFGNVSQDAIIRNFTVDNAVLKTNTAGVIGCNVSGIVKNVVINVDMQGRKNSSPMGYLVYEARIENVEITALNATRTDGAISLFAHWAKGTNTVVSNVSVNKVEDTPIVYSDKINISLKIEIRRETGTDDADNDLIGKDEQWNDYVQA